jgi:hypothetical protein
MDKICYVIIELCYIIMSIGEHLLEMVRFNAILITNELLRNTILYDSNILSGHIKLKVVISIINFFA